jgi:hypothetical protein
MKRITIALCMMLTIGIQAEAQKPAQSKAPFFSSARSPALPVEAGIIFHRMKNKALYLTIKNTGTRPIKKVTCSASVTDRLTMKRVAEFNFLTFDYAVEDSPRQSYTAILDENELPQLKSDDITFGKCDAYAYSKNKAGNYERRFIPNQCTQDTFVFSIISVTFSDGTTWLSPEFAGVIRDNDHSKGAPAKPFEQPSFKMSRLKQRKITKQEFGERWAFVPSEGVLACSSFDEERLFFIDGAKAYALNGWAIDSKIDGVKVSPNLKEVISNDNGLQFFMKMASSLCQ